MRRRQRRRRQLRRRQPWALATIGGLCLGLLACGSDDGGGGSSGGGAGGSSGGGAGGSSGGGAGGSSGGGAGSATLTIGEMTFEASQVGCVFSADAAGNADFPFNLSAFGESPTGARAQLVADIYDPSGQERLSGDGVEHNISFTDVENFTAPTIKWEDVEGPLAAGAMTVITIDGKQISGEGVFDDGTTDEIENIPGTLEVTCP